MNNETGDFPANAPIDLGREGDFALGALAVSPSTREVARGGEREALEPRVMQVLVCLVQAAGKVVSRDDLIARCWDGRIVGEDAINRAIGRLRRLSESDDGASFTIETIARVGYRLHAAAPSGAVMPSAAASGAAEARRVTPPAKWRLIGGAALLLVVAACGVAAWWLWPETQWMVDSSRPFLSSLALEGEPAFSPDGAMLAYTSGTERDVRNIYVRSVAGGDGIKLTSDAAYDASPSWSSDGARLAYVAQKPDQPCRLMVVTVPAGQAREAGRCVRADESSVAWQPGSSALYYTDGGNVMDIAIWRLDMDSGARVQVTHATRTNEQIEDLRCSPDGKSLLYLELENLGVFRIMVRDLASGQERILGKLPQGGVAAWSADSRTVLASISRGIGSEIMAYPLGSGAAYRLYATAANINHITVGSGGLLALETDASRRNLARASATPGAQPDVIDAANGLSWSPTFAPDGTLAFLSNRSGANAVWIMKPGAAATLLFDGGSAALSRLRFSPDGKLLAVAMPAVDHVTLRILTADGASLSSFDMPSVGFGMPTWTPDSEELIVFDRRVMHALRFDVHDPSRRSIAAGLRWDGVSIRAGGTFAIRADKPGIWQIDKGVRLITDKYPAAMNSPITFVGADVLIPDFPTDGAPRLLGQPVAGGPAHLVAFAPAASRYGDFAVDPRNGGIVYPADVVRDSNIDLLTLTKR